MRAEFISSDRVVDEYGDEWTVTHDDGPGYYAVERETHDAWHAGEVALVAGDYELYPAREGDTFGVNCQDEYIVEGGRWVENEKAEAADDDL